MKLKKFIFKKINSTNDTAIRLIKEGEESGIITADTQTKGKGQRGNKWISKKGNLFITIFFNINDQISLKKLTSISCKIVKRSLLKLINKKITIKKPNDLLINKKKVCGILQETVFFKNKKFAIIGIGLNINRSPIIDNYPTTHLNFFSKKKITSFKIYNEIKKNFESYLNN